MGATDGLTLPIPAVTPVSVLGYAFIWNRRSRANSRIVDDASFVKPALYPKVKIRARQSSGSSASQLGQKQSGSRRQHHVPRDEPPRPWTKMRSARGSRGACTSESPSLLAEPRGEDGACFRGEARRLLDCLQVSRLIEERAGPGAPSSSSMGVTVTVVSSPFPSSRRSGDLGAHRRIRRPSKSRK